MSLTIKENEPLSQYTTLHIGGVADYLVTVTKTSELIEALEFAAARTKTPPLILGGGSNVLCADDGYRGLVIINRLVGYEVTPSNELQVAITVGAGEVFDEIVARTVNAGYWGLENLSAIPGSVGATPIQNVGAYGVEISSLVSNVEAIHLTQRTTRAFTPTECQFGYRDSFFKTKAGKEWCVTAVTYQLSTTPKPILSYKDLASLPEEADQATIRDHVIAVRAKKFPDWKTVGTAGSFFKNPIISVESYKKLAASYPELPGYPISESTIKVSLGWVLDKICGLKGYQVGPVRLYEAQALVLVAEAGATATAVEIFVTDITTQVQAKTGITIEREVLSV